MPSNLPNRPSPEIIDHLVDTLAWAKTCMLIAGATPTGGAERSRELEKFRQAVVEPRRIVDEIFGQGKTVPHNLIIELRVCELAIPRLEAGAILRQTKGAP